MLAGQAPNSRADSATFPKIVSCHKEKGGLRMSHNRFLFADAGSFTGNFEGMYKAEDEANFDSWSQDQMSLYKRIDLLLVEQYNFDVILDIGCGKGYFTSLLKKVNNKVRGLDISETAIEKAHLRFPGIDFAVCNVADTSVLSSELDHMGRGGLVVARALLYYLPNWRDVLRVVSRRAGYALLGVNIPANTRLYIRNKAEFLETVGGMFDIIECIDYPRRDSMTILANSKGATAGGND